MVELGLNLSIGSRAFQNQGRGWNTDKGPLLRVKLQGNKAMRVKVKLD